MTADNKAIPHIQRLTALLSAIIDTEYFDIIVSLVGNC